MSMDAGKGRVEHMDRIEQKILDIIEARKDDIIAFGDDIWHHAERGFQEFRTSEKLIGELKKLGLEHMQTGLAVTGVKAYLKDPANGYKHTIALMGEMDGLPIPDHPNVNPETGIAHACWHNAQITGVLGAAMALTDPEVAEAIDGNIVFFGCPAEEMGEADDLVKLQKEGKIQFFGGKAQLMSEGALDDLDMIVAHHTMACGVGINNMTTNCNMSKRVTFFGKAAHGTRAPFGVDALEAASLAMAAINTQRECFQEKDYVRIHGFFVDGGTANNIIADSVQMSYSIRASYPEALKNADFRVDRAIKGAAAAVGAGVRIETFPGYLSDRPAQDIELLEQVVRELVPDVEPVIRDSAKNPTIHNCASNDYGEVSQFLPFIKFTTGGTEGAAHTKSADIVDLYDAYVVPAKIFAVYAYRLMKNQATELEKFLSVFEPAMAKEEVLDFIRSMQRDETMPMNPAPDFKGNVDSAS